MDMDMHMDTEKIKSKFCDRSITIVFCLGADCHKSH